VTRKPSTLLEFTNPDQWRSWLEINHVRESEAWLVHFKKGYRDGTLLLADAVEEALCFGWIDSTLRSIDERCYALRYSPRRKNSIWSEINKQRALRLIREGRMAPAGLAAVEQAQANGQWELATRREQVDLIPQELEKVLRDRPNSLDAYRALPDSRKKQFIFWITSAKRPATVRRRVAAILKELLGDSGGASPE
jgi:uncharacterized protein YdeI (YjbR/CyaY-like superfamily)